MGKAEEEGRRWRRGRSWERGGERLRRTEEESLETGPAEGKKKRRGRWRAENLWGKVLMQQGQEKVTQWTP